MKVKVNKRYIIMALLAVSIAIFLYIKEHKNREQRIHRFMDEAVLQVDAIIEKQHDHIRMLRSAADAILMDYERLDISKIRNNLVQKKEKDLIRKTQQEWYLEHELNDGIRYQGSPSGIGQADRLSDDVLRELSMVLSLRRPFEQLIRHTDAPWVYYISKNTYMNMPYSTEDFVQFVPEYLEMDVFTFGLPQNNPDREIRWTKAYSDAGGLGMMVSLIIPIYRESEFIGNIGFDMTFKKMTDYMKTDAFEDYDACIVDNYDQVIAHSILTENPDEGVYTFTSLLVPANGKDTVTVNIASDKAFHQFNKKYILKYQLNNNLWDLVFIEEVYHWHMKVLMDMFPKFIIAAFALTVILGTLSINAMNANLKKEIVVRKEAETKAVLANKAKSTFLSNISHELRTPLNSIIGFTGIILKGRAGPVNQEQTKQLTLVQGSGKHLLNLINEILNLAKIEAGKLELSPAPLHLTAFLETVVGSIRSRAKAKHLDFMLETPDAQPQGILADETRLRQVLINLLGNAVKFTDIGHVRLSIENLQRTNENCVLRFQVSDTGVGLTPEQMDRIFLPFEQVGEARRQTEGTGLGLAITRKLVALMGSEIKVESQPGQGSTFWFDLALPIVEVEVKEKPVQYQDIIGYKGERQKALVVDDNLYNRLLLVNMLEPLGFEVIQAENGRQGVDMAREIRPNMILTDLRMPGMDGLEAARAIRRITGLENIPIIATSASVLEADREKSLLAVADAFLLKPLQTDELFDKMAFHLKLEWEYREKAIPAPKRKIREGKIVYPSKEALKKLYDYARQYEYQGLEEQLKIIKNEDRCFLPFVEKIHQFSEDYRMPEIIDILRKNLEDTP